MRRVNDARRQSEKAPVVRRRPWPRGGKLLLLWGGIGSAVAVLGGTVAWLIVSGWLDRQVALAAATAVELSADAGFTIDHVLADGRRETSSSDILGAVGVRMGQPIFDLDLVGARTRVEQLPWVQSATVERRLPDTLYVQVTEVEPLALWQQQQKPTDRPQKQREAGRPQCRGWRRDPPAE